MSQTKYITSGGLAFAEYEDMDKLRRYSLKGWHVSGFSFMGYTLKKGENKDYIYSIDYRFLHADERDEYFAFFFNSGWTHVTSEGDIHLFRAHAGTKPIYTDPDTTIEKYENSSGSIVKFAVPLFVLTALSWGGVMLSSSTLQSIFLVLAVILTVFVIPTAWTLLKTFGNKWKVEGKRSLVELVKIAPFLFLTIMIIILLFVRGTGTTIRILASMVIGGITFPTAVWIVMALYHKFRRKHDYTNI